MAKPAKRMKQYFYDPDFEHRYLVTNQNGTGICLLCIEQGVRFTCPRKSNIKRHYRNKHGDYDTMYPLNSKERLEQIEMWKAVVSGSRRMSMRTPNLNIFTANRIVFMTAYDIVKDKRPFTHAEVFAEWLIKVFETMSEGSDTQEEVMDFVRKLPLSRASIIRRIRLLSENIRHQFLRDLDECSGFSIQVHRSTNVKSEKQVLVYFRIVFPNCSVREHLFACLSVQEVVNAESIYEALKAELVMTKVPLNKLVSITTDRAAIMIECEDGLVARLRADPDFPKFTAFRCLLHQRPNGSRKYIGSETKESNQSADVKWLMRNAYMTDITEIINATNTITEGSMKFIGEYFANFDHLEAYMESAMNCLKHNRIPNLFSRLTKLFEESGMTDFDGRPMFDFTKKFLEALNKRLADFSDVKAIVNYFKNPFDKSVDANQLTDIIARCHPVDKCGLHYEIENLRLDNKLEISSKAGNDIWRIMNHIEYANLNMVHKRIYSIFGTTYLCKSVFASLDDVRSTFKTRISDERLHDVLQILNSAYKPDFDDLAEGWKPDDPEEA